MEHKFPRLLKDPKTSMVDYAASTHGHFDHDNLYAFDSATVLDRMIGVWQFADVKVTGLADLHVCATRGMYPWDVTARAWVGEPCPPGQPTEQDNVLYYIEVGKSNKITLLHWGDNQTEMFSHNKEFFKNHPVDIAIIPVDDSGHIVRPQDIPIIVNAVNPKVIIPSHYYIKGIVNPSYTVLTPDRWFVAQKHRKLTGTSRVTITREWLDSLKLPKGEFLAMYFEDRVAFQVIDIPDTWEAELEKSRKALQEFKKQ